MAFVSNIKYRDTPFSSETPHTDFYIYDDIKNLIEKCEESSDAVRCRTIGVLQSEYTKFYLCDMDSTGVLNEYKIRVSMLYYKSTVPSTKIPYPVQVFGSLEWKNRPVLFIRLLQVLPVSTALRLKNIMSAVVTEHLANNQSDESMDPI